MINQIYCITLIQPKDDLDNIGIYLHMKLKKELNWIKSRKILIPKKEYIFLYDHSFEDLNNNHSGNIKNFKNIKIFQNKLDLQQKFSYFIRKLKIEESKNNELVISFVQDTFKQIKKESFLYNIIFNLLQLSYQKTNSFYDLLEEFYNNQKKIYFPKSVNIKKYKPSKYCPYV